MLVLQGLETLPKPAWAVYTAALLFGAIGLLDDGLSWRRARSRGLAALPKFLLSLVAAGGWLAAFHEVFQVPTLIPFTDQRLALPVAAVAALGLIVLLSTTHSMNLTDGLDGLAVGVGAIMVASLCIACPDSATWPALVPLLGALLGFLWVNAHPAGLFLGDVGSFAVGGAVAAAVLMDGLAFVLPLLGGLLVLEALSVIAQVGVYRLTQRRLLRMSPLHHHFERAVGRGRRSILPGPLLDEPLLTMRLWILEALFAAVAVLAMSA
jgi:phospho-N-acetylmuramoyl-pentapeptide-transferase